jgi:predicted DNA-binding transcriptional regulator AlpA
MITEHDDHVVTELDAAKFCGISRDTLRRRFNAGNGPKRLRLSAHRIGYRLSDLRSWLEAQAEEAVS